LSDTIEPMPTTVTKQAKSDVRSPQALAQELVQLARTEGVELVGSGGLLTGLTKMVLETALDAELTEHLRSTSTTQWFGAAGTPAPGAAERRCWPSSARSTQTCPEPRAGTFEPVIIERGQRRLNGVDQRCLRRQDPRAARSNLNEITLHIATAGKAYGHPDPAGRDARPGPRVVLRASRQPVCTLTPCRCGSGGCGLPRSMRKSWSAAVRSGG
jgi:hypothetical protein